MMSRTWQRTLGYLAAWLASAGLTGADLYMVRGALLQILMWLAVHQSEAAHQQDRLTGQTWGARINFADNLAIILFSLVGLALMLFFEHYYRRAADAGRLARRVPVILGIQAIIAMSGWLVQQLIS